MARKRRSPRLSPSDSAGKRQVTAVAEENIRAIAKIQAEAARKRTPLQRASDRVAALASQEHAILIHAVWFTAWIIANCGLLPIPPFDPFPFSLLTTIVSLEAIFLTLFVLSSQGRMTVEAEKRAHLDLQINLLSEQEMTMVLQMLREVCEKLGVHKTIHSAKFTELTRRTDVGEIAKHLEHNVEATSRKA